MQLSQALRVCSKQVVALVGAGGKTSTLFRLADELAAQGKRVVCTTTTRLALTQVAGAVRASLLRYDGSSNFLARVVEAIAAHDEILIVGDDVDQDKVAGVPPGLVDALAALDAVDVVIYEADGARMLPFKAPAAHEPVLASSTSLLVPVIGVGAIGSPLDDSHVHRAEIVARLAGARPGETVTPTMAARVLAHPEGGLKGRPGAARVTVLINHVDSQAQLDAARLLARLLLGYKEIQAVAIGAVQEENPIRETHQRVAAIVTAAGEGVRMQGRIKQLLPWRGRTLIENSIRVVKSSQAAQVLVVLGAHAEEIRAKIQGQAARVVLNRDWKTGHASSIRAGLNALDAGTAAAVFVNADQPLLTTDAVNRIIQRYYETAAPIIAPLYAGKRGSPVLFDRDHFTELMGLQGDQGGRELIATHRDQVEFVEFDDAQMALDVDTPEDYGRLADE
jgi:molybdenum cofactor cytidylyltransferase